MHFFNKVQVRGVQRARILIMNHVSKMKLGYCSKQGWAIFRLYSGIIQPFTLFSCFLFLFFQILSCNNIPYVSDSNAPVSTHFLAIRTVCMYDSLVALLHFSVVDF